MDASSKKLHFFSLFALLVVASLLAFGSLTKGHDWGDDFASYIMQARSVVEFDPQTFVEANLFTLTHSEIVRIPLVYPWGAPVILAPAYAAFGLDIHALKIPNVACFLMFLLTLFLFARGYHSSVFTLFVVAIFSTSPLLLMELNRIGSDIPFMLASTLSMLLIDATVMRGRRLICKNWDASILGLCLATSISIRPNGWLLVLTLLFAHALKLRAAQRSIHFDHTLTVETHSRAQVTLPYISCGTALLVWNIIFPVSISRLSAVPPITPEIFNQNTLVYLLLPSQFFYGAPYPLIFYSGALGFVVLGVRASWARTPHFLFYCGTTLGLLVLWPFYQGVRFILPIVPFFFHFMLEGVRTVRSQLGPRGVKLFDAVSLSVGVLLIGSLCLASVAGVQKNLRDQRMPIEGPFSKEAREMFNFISTQTDPDDVIVFFKPRLMRLLTERRSFDSGSRVALEQSDYICLFKGPVESTGAGRFPQALYDELTQQGLIQPVFVNDQFLVGRSNPASR